MNGARRPPAAAHPAAAHVGKRLRGIGQGMAGLFELFMGDGCAPAAQPTAPMTAPPEHTAPPPARAAAPRRCSRAPAGFVCLLTDGHERHGETCLLEAAP
jgi:hypothetical protein